MFLSCLLFVCLFYFVLFIYTLHSFTTVAFSYTYLGELVCVFFTSDIHTRYCQHYTLYRDLLESKKEGVYECLSSCRVFYRLLELHTKISTALLLYAGAGWLAAAGATTLSLCALSVNG